ncbi:MAG TPA: DUF4278 domain-containing protein [Coleofasciculaceae cyanobacterium]|jgi:hypothetical protein
MTTFKYRGAEYSLEPSAAPEPQSDRTLNYRGQAYEANAEAAIQPVRSLVYRGVAYRTTPNDTPETVQTSAQVAKPVPVQTKLSALSTSRGANQMHRRSLLQSLQRRMAIARAKGDRHLTHQLQKELDVLTGGA